MRWFGKISIGGTIAVISMSHVPKSVSAQSPVHASSIAAEVPQRRLSQAQENITFAVRDSTLRFVIDEIGRKAGVRIVLNESATALKKRVSVQITRMTALDALGAALKGSGLYATVASDGRTILVGPALSDSTQRARQGGEIGTIQGTVVDSANGTPIAGTSVLAVGTAAKTVTGEDGRFTLKVEAGEQTLRFQLLGYKSITRSVTVTKAQTLSIRVQMTSTPTALAGVVTTATGVQERRSVGNDITVLNVDSIMQMAPVSSVTDILETRVPGLTVIRSSGIPGAPSRIRLRGIGGGLVGGAANTSNDPIVIVDGIRVYAQQSTYRDQNLAPGRVAGTNNNAPYSVPSALDQIDPNSIETIEVFKGPSATSQWGSDAANGVIVITTKKGRSGETQYSMTLNAGTERMPGSYAPIQYYRFAHAVGNLVSQACSVFRSDGACTVTDSIVPFQALNSPVLSPFGTGSQFEGSFSVSGGSNAVVYALTGSIHERIGYLKMPTFYRELYEAQYGTRAPTWMRRPTGYEGWGLTTSMTARPSQTLAITVTTSLNTSDAARSSGERLLNELSSLYLDTARLRMSPFASEGGITSFMERGQSKRVISNIGIKGEWTRWTSLLLSATVGINTDNREDRTLVPFGREFRDNRDTLGSFSIGKGHAVTRSLNLNGELWSGRLVSNAIGVQVTQIATNDFGARSDTLYPGIGEPTQLYRANQRSFASTTAGWFVEPKLNLHSRFFLIPGFRFDGGSASSGGRTGRGLLAFFPKLNFSWVAIDREGMTPLGGILSLLRLRFAFGVAGVQPEPSWSLRMMSVTDSAFTSVYGDGLILRTLGNPDLRPERSREIEGGFEASVWNGRINLNLSAIRKLRIDAIQQLNVAPSVSSMIGRYYSNIGRVEDTGLEISLDARVLETRMFAMSVNGSMTKIRDVILALSDAAIYAQMSPYDGTQFRVGYPISGRWGRPIVGYRTNPTLGRITRDDYTLADSAIYLGAGFPKWQLPFGATFSFLQGAASLSAQFEYKQGLTQFNSASQARLERLYADPNATFAQQAVAVAAFEFTHTGSRADLYGSPVGLVQTINSLRWNSVSLSYNIPRSLTARVHIPSAALSLQGSNLGLWTNYRGKDPDVNSVRIGEDVRDDGEAPRPRMWKLRLTLRN